MAQVNKDGHLGRGDHLEYLALEDAGDTETDVLAAVSKAFSAKFGAIESLCAKFVAQRRNDGYWRVRVYP